MHHKQGGAEGGEKETGVAARIGIEENKENTAVRGSLVDSPSS